MSPETIVVDRLSKTYQVPEREGGFGAAVRSFFKRKYKDVKAVQQVDFQDRAGRDRRLSRPERRRKNNHAQNAFRFAAPHRWHGKCTWLYALGAQARLSALHDSGDGAAQPPGLGYPCRRFVPAQPGDLSHPG